MPLEVEVEKPQSNGWIPGWFTGAKPNQNGGYKLNFKLTDGRFADWFFPVKISQGAYDNLRRANGLEPEKVDTVAVLPMHGETEAMGYNKLIEIYVTQKDKFLNVRDVRSKKGDKSRHEDPFKNSGGTKDPFSPPDDGEDVGF